MLLIFSGILALITVLTYALRGLSWSKIENYDVVADIGGHFLHGVFMVYMAKVMLGVTSAYVGWEWVSLLFLGLAFVFVFRTVQVQRVQFVGVPATAHYQAHSAWWWDPLHAGNNLAMAYMFLPIALWLPLWTLLAMVSPALILVIYARKLVNRLKQTPSEDRRFDLYSDVGHVAMAMSMLMMLYVMQWNMVGMDHSAHGSHMNHDGHHMHEDHGTMDHSGHKH